LIPGPSRRALIACVPAFLAAPWLHASEHEVVLQVTGRVKSGSVRLRLDDLRKLPQHSFVTNTPWTREPHTYAGPLLRDVLVAAGADLSATTIRAVALNDYQITIPLKDALSYPVIVAHQRDGKPMPVRDRGPLFIIYPFDGHPDLQSTRFYQRAIWQLKSMQVD
jgi:hypothetical protein